MQSRIIFKNLLQFHLAKYNKIIRHKNKKIKIYLLAKGLLNLLVVPLFMDEYTCKEKRIADKIGG